MVGYSGTKLQPQANLIRNIWDSNLGVTTSDRPLSSHSPTPKLHEQFLKRINSSIKKYIIELCQLFGIRL